MSARGVPALLAWAVLNRAARNVPILNHATGEVWQKARFHSIAYTERKMDLNGIFHGMG